MFNTELVKGGLFSSSHNRTLSGLQRSRELADYDAAVAFSTDDATQFSTDDATQYLNDARTFAGEAMTFLRNEGWLS